MRSLPQRSVSRRTWRCGGFPITLACFGKLPGALAAGRAVSADEAWGDAAEAAGLGDGGPWGEPVGAVRAVCAAPRPRLAMPRQRVRLGAALPAGARMAGSQPGSKLKNIGV